MKKLLCLVLACLCFVSLFAACGEEAVTTAGENTTEKSGTTTEATTTEDLSGVCELPEQRYDGQEIVFLMRDSTYYVSDMYVADKTADGNSVVDIAVYNRNAHVEDNYGFAISILKADNGTTGNTSGFDNLIGSTTLATQISSGLVDADVVADHGRGLFTLADQGVLVNWNSLKYVDTSKTYWNQGMVTDFTINDKIYCLSGDLSYQSLGATVCMIMNDDVYEDKGLDKQYDIYNTVIDGNWTFEVFKNMTEMCNDNMNDEETFSLADGDYMGYITTQYRGPITFLYSTGGRIVTKDEDDNLSLTINTQRISDAYDAYFTLLNQENNALMSWNTTLPERFSSGKCLLMDLRMYDIRYVGDWKDYTVLPFPKYDDNTDEYYSWCDAVGNTFGVMVTSNQDRLDFVSFALEAICYQGSVDVIPKFYNITLKQKYSQNELSSEVIDLIKAGRKYDLGCYYVTLFKENTSEPGMALCSSARFKNAGNGGFSSFYDEKESIYKDAIEKLIAFYEE